MSKQLSILIPAREFETSIGPITLKPFPLKEWNKVFDIVDRYKPILTGIETIEQTDENGQTKKIAVNLSSRRMLDIFLEKVGNDYSVLQDLIVIVALCGAISKEQVESLQYDEVVSLAVEIIDQNRDFFRRAMDRLEPKAETPEAPETPEAVNQKTGGEESPA